MLETGHIINGVRVAGTSDRIRYVSSPTIDHEFVRLSLAGNSEIHAATTAATIAQADWTEASTERRITILGDFAALIEDKLSEIRDIISHEYAITKNAAEDHILSGLHLCEKLVGLPLPSSSASSSSHLSANIHSVQIHKGLGAMIFPSNYNANISMWMFIPTVMSGNALILKPGQHSPFSIMRVVETLHDAGLPNGILQVVNGDEETISGILTHQDIATVSFIEPDIPQCSVIASVKGKHIFRCKLTGQSEIITLSRRNEAPRWIVPLALDMMSLGGPSEF